MADNSRIDHGLLEAWVKHEDIAMHFNQMILKVRIQALGALAAIITIGGVVLKAFPPVSGMPWAVAAVVFFILIAFWAAIWALDFLYYNKLLMGAVDAILKLENEINSEGKVEIVMSHIIEDAVRGRQLKNLDTGTLIGPLVFYLIVFIVLAIGFLISLCNCI